MDRTKSTQTSTRHIPLHRQRTNPASGNPRNGPELFFALVGAVGTDLETVEKTLTDCLSEVRYTVRTIRLSGLLQEIDRWKDLPTEHLDEHIETHMNAGNELRDTLGRGDALAVLAIQKIRSERAKVDADDKPIPRCAYVLRSLKSPNEVRSLRRVYGSPLWVISAYSPRAVRTRTLASMIAKSRHSSRLEHYMSKAEALVERDEAEIGKRLGQNVRETFPLADVFIDVSASADVLNESVTRFIEALFGYPFHTPSRDEYGMFHARAAALRSASLGRQVGTAVATNDGDIVAVGSNEVPKAEGGLYWPDSSRDQRDFRLGYDQSDRMKREVLWDILSRLRNANWLVKTKSELAQEPLIADALAIMEDAQLMDLIEFGRTVHAEMAALLNAAHRGVSVDGCTLYTTTFPCHDCARHIIAAGVRRVVYVEPYPKSLAAELHQDSIIVDSAEPSPDHVNFKPFVGIAPRRYMILFSMVKRKEKDGKIVPWEKSRAVPRYPGSPPTYLRNEAEELAIMYKEMMRQKLMFESESETKHKAKRQKRST